MKCAPWGSYNGTEEDHWWERKLFCVLCLIPWACGACTDLRAQKNEECMNSYLVGEVSADKFFLDEDFRNRKKTFMIFLGGFMISWIGFYVALWLLVADLQWIPFVQSMIYLSIELDKLNWITTMCFTAMLNVTSTIWIYAIIYTWWRYAIGIPLIVCAIISTWLTFGNVWNLIIR